MAEVKDLLSLVDTRLLECLNQDDAHTIQHAIGQGTREDDAVYLASDCDEQLLITVPFNQTVKVHSISIKALDADKAPNQIKLFSNPIGLGFDSAESDPGTQILDLTPEQVAEGTVVPLRFVKFQAVNSLAIFIKGNFGDEEQTVVHKIQLYGCPVNTTNMGDWEKVAKKAKEES
uniref:PITH domain-containing protein n=1 Tax=Hemiselmis tepida TaxID=464990 RepID=A0A7S0YTQ9_9CRYP